MEAYSLYEVNEYIKRVLALNFEEPIWVECEISQLKEVRSQIYIDLIQKSESSNDIIAQTQGVIWYKENLFITKKLGDLRDAILKEGVKIKLKATVDFHEKYGLKLVIEDIDPSYSLGMFELAKQKIIERLRREDLIDLNARIALPFVIQRIAVISSEKAAGYQDFVAQIKENAYGYDYYTKLFPAAMQGINTEREIVKQLRQIEKDKSEFDIIIIIRGGGSKIDLSSFDNYNIAHQISNSSLPVLTGIGHDIDETVTDLVSHTILKTPTAVADFLIEHNMYAEQQFQLLEQQILISTQTILQYRHEVLNGLQNMLISRPIEILKKYEQELSLAAQNLKFYPQTVIDSRANELKRINDLLVLITPENVLKRGFAIVWQNKKIVTRISQIKEKGKITLEMDDGKKDIN